MILWTAEVKDDAVASPAKRRTYTTSLTTIKDFIRECPGSKWDVRKLDIGGVTNQKICDLLNGGETPFVTETMGFEVSDKGRLKTL